MTDIYNHRFEAIYIGYPHAKVNELFDILVMAGKHWLSRELPGKAKNFIRWQIISSRWYRKQCKKHGIKFIDFTDKKTGFNQALYHFTSPVKNHAP